MMEHDLKCWPEFWDNLASGRKTFEIRIDDRGFALGDTLLIREWHPVSHTYSGREVRRKVTHLLRNWRGIQSGYVVMSLTPDNANDYTALEERCAELSSSLDERQRRVSDLERELAHKHRLFIETSGDYDNAEDRVERLEALLRDAIDDDRVGGGLTVTTIERIEAALALTEDEK